MYLESDKGEQIQLNLQEIIEGQMALTQAVFCLNTDLQPNTNYSLRFENQTKDETSKMIVYNSETNKREKRSWRTTDQKSIALLDSKLSLQFEKTEVQHFGCGPAANAVFTIKNNSESEKWFKTEVVNIKSNKTFSFYLTPRDNKLYVGNNMCSGAFLYHKRGSYKVRFTPMNTDGKSLDTTDWFTYNSPFLNDKT